MHAITIMTSSVCLTVSLSLSLSLPTPLSLCLYPSSQYTEHQVCHLEHTVLTGHHQQYLSEADLIHTVRQHHTEHRSLTAAWSCLGHHQRHQSAPDFSCPSTSHRTLTDSHVELPQAITSSNKQCQTSTVLQHHTEHRLTLGAALAVTSAIKQRQTSTVHQHHAAASAMELPCLSPTASSCARYQLSINITQNTD